MIVTLLLALSTSLADSSSLETEANLSLSSLDRSSQTPSSPGPPTPPATAQTNPVPRARTLWTPHDEAVEQAAEGSLAVCRTALLPFVVVPVLGSAAGLLAEWGCILPAALALEHVSLHHSSRGAELWQSMVALTAGKTAATLVELPMPFLVVGSIVVVGLGTGVAAFYGGLPITTAVAGTVVAGAVVFAAADVAARILRPHGKLAARDPHHARRRGRGRRPGQLDGGLEVVGGCAHREQRQAEEEMFNFHRSMFIVQ